MDIVHWTMMRKLDRLGRWGIVGVLQCIAMMGKLDRLGRYYTIFQGGETLVFFKVGETLVCLEVGETLVCECLGNLLLVAWLMHQCCSASHHSLLSNMDLHQCSLTPEYSAPAILCTIVVPWAAGGAGGTLLQR